MAVTNYFTVDGQMYGEETGGNFLGYVPDALGSVMATTNSGGTSAQNTYRYKPYGEQLAKTGVAADPKFMWVGSRGYRADSTTRPVYVRARHYLNGIALWLSTDSLWPAERALIYVLNRVTTVTDASGLQTSSYDCDKCAGICGYANIGANLKAGIDRFCKGYGDPSNTAIKTCVDACLKKWGDPKGTRDGCLSGFCKDPLVRIKCSTGTEKGEEFSCVPRDDLMEQCPKGCADMKYPIVPLADTSCWTNQNGYGYMIRICCHDPNKDLETCCCPTTFPRYDTEAKCAGARTTDRIMNAVLHELSHACGSNGWGCYNHTPPIRPYNQDCFAECASKCFTPPLYEPPIWGGKCQ